MAWGRLTTKTLTSAGDTITTDTFTAKKFNKILHHRITSGSSGGEAKFNNNSNAVYATRRSGNGAADSTAVSQTFFYTQGGNYASDGMLVGYICSISGQEKLAILFECMVITTGAGSAPDREEQVLKFVPSPDADITRVDSVNAGTGDFATDSNLIVLGTD